MVYRDQLIAALTAWLEPGRFRDYCPNGLQVEGNGDYTNRVWGDRQ